MQIMQINQDGIDLLKHFEGKRLEAYHCEAGVCTIGYGATEYEDGSKIIPGDRINDEDAERLLRKDIKRFEEVVNRLVLMDINENQFSALVCFAFNVGQEAFKNSTLLSYVNQGRFEMAKEEFDRWIFVKSVKSKGLMKRRSAEKQLFTKK
jgi:lysozyme